jgi:hypothetical protein
MHFEVPKAKKWKEFSSEYLMIVVSIITALGLEHAVQAYHHRHLAHEAGERIEAELRDNMAEVDRSIKHNQERQRRIGEAREDFLRDLKGGSSDKVAIGRMLKQNGEALNLSVVTPTLRHEAWDVAVANQAASFIEPQQLQRYAALYAQMRDVDALAKGGGNRLYDGPGLINLFSDLELGQAAARDVARVMRQVESAYASTDSNLVELRKDLAKAFPLTSAEIK